MSDTNDFENLRSGASNDTEEERYRDAMLYGDDPLPRGAVERIVEGALAAPRGRDGDNGDGWNIARDTTDGDTRPRKATPLDRVNDGNRP
jgi:hypothetical protein